MDVIFGVGVSQGDHLSLGMRAGKIHRQDFELLRLDFNADGHSVIRNDAISGGFPADQIRGNPAVFPDHAHRFKVTDL